MALRRKDFLIYSVVQVLGRSRVMRERYRAVRRGLRCRCQRGRFRVVSAFNVERDYK